MERSANTSAEQTGDIDEGIEYALEDEDEQDLEEEEDEEIIAATQHDAEQRARITRDREAGVPPWRTLVL